MTTIYLHAIEFIFLLLFIGAVTGYLAGLFGIGGGTVLVPAFLTLFPFFHASADVVMHCAVGTSLALVIPTSIMAVIKHRRFGHFDFAFYKRWVSYLVIGCLIGVSLIHFITTTILTVVFTLYLYFIIVMSFLRRHTRSDAAAEGPTGFKKIIGAIVIGAFSTLLGMGGGPFTVPFLRTFNFPYLKAIAISSASAIVIGAVGTVGAISAGWGVADRVPYSLGYVNLIAFICIAPVAMVFSPMGAHAAYHMDKKCRRYLYIAFLILIAAYMSFKVFV